MLTFISLSAQVTDRDLLDAYHREDMSIWKTYVDSVMANRLQVTGDYLLYEYGYCGYIVAEAKKEGKESLLPEAKRYVKQYKQHVEALKNQLPKGHYEMYQSAVYVYELRLHESIHPFNAMSLAKEATKLAPNDPLVLSYYGTCLFYSPKPFGSKSDALKWFEKAQPLFGDEQYTYCWVRKANEMYIQQCHDKLKK
ncbi:MAG: hypothetical protein IJV61_02950 [Paludibacteraceae bacterium]|nr:hypothetical protein [Paludibacteraceae bacterium]